MTGRGMARADLITGAVLFVLSLAILHGAWTMDRLEVRHIHPSSAPGLTPGLLGIALAVASVMLIFKAMRGQSATSRTLGQADVAIAEKAADPGALRRLVVAAALCLLYALGMIGRMPFWLATTLFVTAFIALFEWERDATPPLRMRRLAWALFLGLATGVGVSTVFSDLFLVRLP
jgi:hypothetical protein